MNNLKQSVQTFGKKKTATAVAECKVGTGKITINKRPIDLIQPVTLRPKIMEVVALLEQPLKELDVKVRVSGGGKTSQIYAVRQAIAKSVIAYYQKYVDEASKRLLKDALIQYDRSLLVADPRRCEAKKFGGPGARARYQKSYR